MLIHDIFWKIQFYFIKLGFFKDMFGISFLKLFVGTTEYEYYNLHF